MAVDKYDMCSRAMVRIGGKPISSFEGDGAEETVAATLYEPAVTMLLSLYRWRFSSRQEQMTRLATSPSARWEAAYELPSDCLNVHGVTVDDRLIDFDRYENKIFCDAAATDVVILDYTYRSQEAYWPGYFETTLEMRLAADFAIPIAEDTDKAQHYEGRFVRQFAVAKNTDAQGRTARKLPVGGFAAFSRGRP